MRSLRRVLRPRRHALARGASLLALAVLAGVWTSGGATPPPVGAPASHPAPDHFEFNATARQQLASLWRESVGAKEERVACVGGSITGAAWEVTEVEPLPSGYGDSLRVSAMASVDRCGPPRWLGTVHTHVALRDGVSPYTTFSGADRGVMMMWWRRWRRYGIFCLLYSEHDAHCEADGQLLAGPGTHVTY